MGSERGMGCLKWIRHPHPGPFPRLNVGEGIRKKIVGELTEGGAGDAA